MASKIRTCVSIVLIMSAIVTLFTFSRISDTNEHFNPFQFLIGFFHTSNKTNSSTKPSNYVNYINIINGMPRELAHLKDDFLMDLPLGYTKRYIRTIWLGDCEYKYVEVKNNITKERYFFLGGTQVPQLPHSGVVKKKYWNSGRGVHRQDNVLKFLPYFHEFMESLGVIYQLNSGHSLGLCRNNRPFLWDHDGDVYVSMNDFQKVVEYFNELERENERYKKVLRNNSRVEYSICDVYDGRKKWKCLEMNDIPYHECRIVKKNSKWFQLSTMKRRKKYVNDQFKMFDPLTYALIDIFACSPVECEGETVLNKFRDGITCEKMNLNRTCKNGVHPVMYGDGPWNGDTSDDYPVVKICGKTTRIDGLYLRDKERYCLIYSDSLYGYVEGRGANKSPKVPLGRYAFQLLKNN